MSLKRLSVAFLWLALGLLVAGSAQALDFSLVGGGGQMQIGNGLALPIQAAATAGQTGTVFPPLGVPVKPGDPPVLTGTIAKPLLTAGAKQGYQRQLRVPVGVLSRATGKTTVGVKFSNPNLFAVGTNLKWDWPAAVAVFSTGAAVGGGGTGAATITGFGGSMTYSNALGKRFGGPAHFLIAGGVPSGDFLNAPVTIWLKVNGATPACTHSNPTFFGGPTLTTMAQAAIGCVAGVVLAAPTGLAGPGGFSNAPVSTTGPAVIGPNVAMARLGNTPKGTLLPGTGGAAPPTQNPALVKPYPIPAALNSLVPPNNAAQSQPGPWTTGQLIITNVGASPAETFTLSGKDSRTARGGGTIQMVSGALSDRAATGPNANRGWVRLVLDPPPGVGVPALSPVGLAATAALLLLMSGYAMRRRIFA
jgi:hypothetical protein